MVLTEVAIYTHFKYYCQRIVFMKTFQLDQLLSKSIITESKHRITAQLLHMLSKKFNSNRPLIMAFLCPRDHKLCRNTVNP